MQFKTAVLAAAIALVPFAAGASEDGDAAKGENVFKSCRACHAVGEGARNKVGPALNGVVCRALGSAEGYKYSNAMMAKADGGTIWTKENLDAFLENPTEYLGGRSKMPLKLRNEDKREDVIAYLAQFQADGTMGEPAVCGDD
jgi:cytochrome c